MPTPPTEPIECLQTTSKTNIETINTYLASQNTPKGVYKAVHYLYKATNILATNVSTKLQPNSTI